MTTQSSLPARKRSRLGLFWRLMGAFLIVVLCMAVLFNWLARRATRDEFTVYTTAASQQQAAVLAQVLGNYYLNNNGSWENLDRALRTPRPGMMRGRPGMLMGPARVLVADTNGRIVADSQGELHNTLLGNDNLNSGAPITVDGDQVGTVLVTANDPAVVQNPNFLRQVNRTLLLAALLTSGVALLLGGMISWGITRPLRQLTAAVKAIAAGDLSQRVDIEPGNEIGDLAAAVNTMAAELERAEQLRRQMTADIAHELRTPIAVIQGNLEGLQDGVFPLTREALDPIEDKTALLARLVEDLRQLALAEAGKLPLDTAPTDLPALVQRTVEGFQPAAEAKRIRLEVETAVVPHVTADAQRIEQVLANLLSNALRHTPADGRITIRVVGEDSAARVTVSDSGPGIAAAELPYLFERFYRVDKGRGREKDGSGSGLGLAVARSIIVAHDGRIGVESAPGAGATFWFTLPAAA